MSPGERRHSVASEPSLVADPEARAKREAHNGVLQFDLGMRMVEDALAKGDQFRLRPSAILSLHRVALDGLSSQAGVYRPAGVGIEGSEHRPVDAHLVPELVEDLCEYVNSNWRRSTPLHVAAYVMWRLNWIHPFTDGNGRTSRVTSYVVLCIRSGLVIPGHLTIPDQIVKNRAPYFEALEKADAAWKAGRLDVSAMELLLENLLAVQLADVFERAKGKVVAT